MWAVAQTTFRKEDRARIQKLSAVNCSTNWLGTCKRREIPSTFDSVRAGVGRDKDKDKVRSH